MDARNPLVDPREGDVVVDAGGRPRTVLSVDYGVVKFRHGRDGIPRYWGLTTWREWCRHGGAKVLSA